MTDIKRYWQLIAVAVCLTGCAGSCMQLEASVKGYTKICIDHYTWVFIHGDYAQQQLGGDGKPVGCNP